MHHAYICLLTVVLSLVSNSEAKSHLQFSLPREFLGDASDEDDMSTGILERSAFETDESTDRLQTALRAFLELDEGELRSLLKGISVEKVKNHLSPSTAFFLEASRSKLEILKDLLKKKRGFNLQGDFRIAKRNKKHLAPFRRNLVEGDYEGRNFEATGDTTDSLLGALTELSAAIGMDKRRKKKPQKKHKRHSFHSSSKTHNIHYSYWLKPEDCPKSRDGFSRVHCPSPNEEGEWLCVEDTDLCDGYSHCPDNEDEEPMACLFFKSMQNYVELLVSALLSSLRS